MDLISIDENQIPEIRAQVESQTFELLAVFPEGFDTAVMAYETTAGTPAPHVALYYNSASTDSQATYSTMSAILNAFESSMANKFDVNTDGDIYDLSALFAEGKNTSATYSVYGAATLGGTWTKLAEVKVAGEQTPAVEIPTSAAIINGTEQATFFKVILSASPMTESLD
jgi:hypothetical protein